MTATVTEGDVAVKGAARMLGDVRRCNSPPAVDVPGGDRAGSVERGSGKRGVGSGLAVEGRERVGDGGAEVESPRRSSATNAGSTE